MTTIDHLTAIVEWTPVQGDDQRVRATYAGAHGTYTLTITNYDDPGMAGFYGEVSYNGVCIDAESDNMSNRKRHETFRSVMKEIYIIVSNNEQNLYGKFNPDANQMADFANRMRKDKCDRLNANHKTISAAPEPLVQTDTNRPVNLWPDNSYEETT